MVAEQCFWVLLFLEPLSVVFSSLVPQWHWVLKEEYQTNSFQSLFNICGSISPYNFWHRWDFGCKILGQNPLLMNLRKLIQRKKGNLWFIILLFYFILCFIHAERILQGSEGRTWKGSGMFSLRVALWSVKLKAYCLHFLPFSPSGLPHLAQSKHCIIFPDVKAHFSASLPLVRYQQHKMMSLCSSFVRSSSSGQYFIDSFY